MCWPSERRGAPSNRCPCSKAKLLTLVPAKPSTASVPSPAARIGSVRALVAAHARDVTDPPAVAAARAAGTRQRWRTWHPRPSVRPHTPRELPPWPQRMIRLVPRLSSGPTRTRAQQSGTCCADFLPARTRRDRSGHFSLNFNAESLTTKSTTNRATASLPGRGGPDCSVGGTACGHRRSQIRPVPAVPERPARRRAR